MLKEWTVRARNSIVDDSIFRRLLSNTGWLFGTNGLGLILGFLQGILVARLLGVVGYGLLGLITTFVTLGNGLTSFRMSDFVVKFASEAVAQGRREYAATIIKFALMMEAFASALAFGIMILIAPLGNRYFIHTPGAEQLISLYAVSILGNLALEATTGILQVFNSFQKLSLSLFGGRFLLLLITAAVFLLHGGMQSILLANIAGNLFTSVLALWFAFRIIVRHLGKDWWRASMRDLSGKWKMILGFTLSTNLSTTLSLAKDGDLLFLGFFRSPLEVGYYKLAKSLVNLLLMPIAPLSQVAYPEIAREVAVDNWVKFRQVLRKGTWMAVGYVVPAFVFFWLVGPWLVGTFYGSEFLPAILPCLILLVGNGFNNVFFWNRPALLALGLPGYPLKVGVLTTALRLAFYIVLLPMYGFIGSAVASTVSYFIGNTLLTRRALRESSSRTRS